MPLRAGKGQKTVSGNVKELLDSWKEKGTIGNARPKSMAEARRMAVAIAYKKARGK